jgi:hypothetical protein
MGFSSIKGWLTGLWLCLVLLGSTEAKIIYVDDDAVAPGDGSSWQTAYKFLQDALADADDSEKPVEIRVAQGTYKPDQGAGQTPRDVKATFRLMNGVVLKGGYAGLTELNPDEPDRTRYRSVLSGDLGDDDPDVNEPWDRIYRGGRNSETVVTGSGTDTSAILEAFTIRGGHYPLIITRINPKRAPQPKGSGGGMNNLRGSPTVIGCTFIGNTSFGAGGAMCNEGGSHPTIIDCAFVRNYAAVGGGGAIANLGGSNPTLTRCAFSENHGVRNGGAVHTRGSSPTFSDCTFFGNTVEAGSYGGAIYNQESTCRFEDCRFEQNTGLAGGAICNYESATVVLEGCLFAGNRANYGGAIMGRTKDSTLTAVRCTFRQNSASGSGGALSSWSSAQVSNCVFSGNTCRIFGGAVDIRGGTFANCLFVGNRAFDRGTRSDQTWFPGTGGAVSHPYSMEALHFTNCTFHENCASFGSAVYTSDGWPDFRNCILRGPASLIRSDPYEQPPQVAYCNVEGGWPGAGNIDVDPAFTTPGYWADPNDPNRPGDPNDPNTVWVDGDYHLESQAGRWDPTTDSWVIADVTSPCVDAGDPNSPIGEEPFPNGGRVNMGAYGGTAEASMSPEAGPTAGLWCEPVPLAEVNLEAAEEWSPALSADGLTLYFSRVHAPDSYYGRIWQATRLSTAPDSRFTPVVKVPGTLNQSVEHVFCPWVSPDGLRLYYTHQVGSVFRLMVSTRPDGSAPWPQGVEMAEINALHSRLHTARLTTDELTIFFAGPDTWDAGAEYDIWMATRPDREAPFGEPVNVTVLNSPANDLHATPSADGLTLYFASQRSGRYQLFKSTRVSLTAAFGPPVRMPLFDTADGHSMFPYLSPDGTELYFMRQTGTDRSARDIWVSYRLD